MAPSDDDFAPFCRWTLALDGRRFGGALELVAAPRSLALEPRWDPLRREPGFAALVGPAPGPPPAPSYASTPAGPPHAERR